MDNEQIIKNKLLKNQQFNETRTSIGKSFLCQLFLVFVPGLCLWLFLGPDFQEFTFNHFHNLGSGANGKLWVICLGYIGGSMILISFTCLLKFQKVDSLTFALAITFACSSVILNGLWMFDWGTKSEVIKVVVRFVITLGLIFVGLFLGTLLTTIARNLQYKRQLKKAAILAALDVEGPEQPSVA